MKESNKVEILKTFREAIINIKEDENNNNRI